MPEQRYDIAAMRGTAALAAGETRRQGACFENSERPGAASQRPCWLQPGSTKLRRIDPE
jgi:hypothetical protein